MELLNGKEISKKIKELLHDLNQEHTPGLAIIQVGNNEASNIYIKSKIKACQEVGIDCYYIKLDEDIEELNIIDKIIMLNEDPDINGIIVQLPLPQKYNTQYILDHIAPNKDVDGLTEQNQINLINQQPCFIPCTPAAVLKLLDQYNIELKGKNVTIIGRSNLVGRPLMNLMLNRNATVTVCHSQTPNLQEHTKNADILISAVGKKGLITEDMVKENAVVIDVGITRVNGKIYGDVDFDVVAPHTSYITPVPGGVGPMTVAMLLQNTTISYMQEQNKINLNTPPKVKKILPYHHNI